MMLFQFIPVLIFMISYSSVCKGLALTVSKPPLVIVLASFLLSLWPVLHHIHLKVILQSSWFSMRSPCHYSLKWNCVYGLYTGASNGLVLTCSEYCVFPAVMHSFSHQITDCIIFIHISFSYVFYCKMLMKISLFIDAIYYCVVKTEICRNVQYTLVAFLCCVEFIHGQNYLFLMWGIHSNDSYYCCLLVYDTVPKYQVAQCYKQEVITCKKICHSS